jgi:hypothetical protein
MDLTDTTRLAAITNTYPGEAWRPIPGYEQTYAISTYGRIWSAPRPTTSGGLLSQRQDRNGYPMVNLIQDGAEQSRRVHILVALAFLGPRPAGMQIRHLDGDTSNPHVANLAYGTPRENGLDAVSHGKNRNANKTHCPRGHPYDSANTLVSGGRRYCRTCKRAREVADGHN